MAVAAQELELPGFEYLNPELKGERFHAELKALREQGWLASMPLGFVVLDREGGEFFLRSRSFTFPGLKIAEIFGIDDGPLAEEIRRNILHINGADHSRLRGLVNPAFTPRAVERWRPFMRETITALFEAARPGDDLVEALAKPYPSRVIATLMGAPVADADRLWTWSNLIQRQFGMTVAEERPQIERAVTEFSAYTEALMREKRAHPGDDLVSGLLDRAEDVELLHLVLNVLVGGVDTTQAQLAHALNLFAAHPDQWQRLGDDPDLAPQAVEEVVRFEPITPFTARIAMEDVVFRDVLFPKDTIVLVCAHSGNRDGVGDTFDITREPKRLLTFGAGPHYCLGVNLAKAELQQALAHLAPRMRGLELVAEPVYGTIDGIYGLDELRATWR
ncbi:cytochrome P450 [Solirubrobacter sp. CPCC 204708]|uniref:Cytochrome P450 n=1 Tax=Solirubrobacter deserti TaxID=2282478 RepID=A0ABT4RUJ6_9ACTN|nr:cytochrome P450 [Solirubrobacter deserti]MBE2316467.1 cytochrome P450 [Solirubrobacter deserti]MDA0142157.1 cytochrome P450 [Solirubrobacter deserti]